MRRRQVDALVMLARLERSPTVVPDDILGPVRLKARPPTKVVYYDSKEVEITFDGVRFDNASVSFERHG